MRRLAIGILFLPIIASADEPVASVRTTSLRDGFEGLDGPRDSTRLPIPLGPSVRAIVESTWWATDRDVAVHDDSIDTGLIGHGYRVAAQLSRDLGILGLRVGASYAIEHVDTRDGSGTFHQVALSIGRTFHLSRWMTAWISLDLGVRSWQGRPPPGEADAGTVMLSIGTTFR